jgi:putative two-component system response regulator
MISGPILCVDDDPVNLGVLRQALKNEFSLVFAGSGAEALTAVKKHRPALILIDVQMPEMDGYEVCRQLKRSPESAQIPVIFVTNLADETDEEAGFDAGGVDYIIKPISAPIVQARVRTHLSLVRAATLEYSYRSAIYMLAEAGHYNDTDTGVHIWKMAAYCRALAEAVGWSAERCALLELAAPTHDTGKIGMPDSVLKKPGKLDPAEWEIMRTHARIGYDILRKSDAPVFQLAAEIALSHHEKWDGSGYPNGLAGLDIPESGRLVAVADVFDALTMQRAYRDAWPLDRVLATLKEGSRSHFDPTMLDAFLGILPAILDIRTQWDSRAQTPNGIARIP